MKKISCIFVMLLSFLLVGCNEKVALSVSSNEILIKREEVHTIDVISNDKKGYTITSQDELVVEVLDDNKIKGLKKGIAEIKITAKSNNKIFALIIVEVIEVDLIDMRLAVDMEVELQYKNVTYEIDNEYVLSIENNILKALLRGKTLVRVLKEDVLIETIEVEVFPKAINLSITSKDTLYNDESLILEYDITPRNAFNEVKFVVEDKSILMINHENKIVPIKIGTTKVKVVSLQDEELFDEISMTILGTIVISSQSSLKIGEWEYRENVDLFNNIENALNAIDENINRIKVLEGNYEGEFTLNNDVELIGINATIDGTIKINTNNVVIDGFNFINDSKVINEKPFKELIFSNNLITDINNSFIELTEYDNVSVKNNKFKHIEGIAINLVSIKGKSKTLIEKNIIEDSNKAISLQSNNRIAINYYIKIYRNVINNVGVAFDIDLDIVNFDTNAELYGRFNEVYNYDIAVNSSSNVKFEFTFNYWDKFYESAFINLDEKYTLENYLDKGSILSEEKYDPKKPIIVELTNDVSEVWIGEETALDISVLPYTSDIANINISISDNRMVELTRTWTLKPKKSGMVELTLGIYGNKEAEKKYEIKSTTDPGIYFGIEDLSYALHVGDEFELNPTPYPFDRVNDNIKFVSSNKEIATVNSEGLVTITGVGLFEITAILEGDVEAIETIYFESFEKFAEDDLLGFILDRTYMYSKLQEITLYGAGTYDVMHNRSVNRVLFEGHERKQSIIPVSPGFRPGEGYNENITEEYKRNEENLVWIVVHDTGNNNAGAGAELHARYLQNQVAENGRQASWHFTVDSVEIYQHLPTNERGYHAGDGLTIPGVDKLSPSLGGGNQNGIGVEMSVQRDGHVYKTWQNTARLVAELLVEYNLDPTHQKYHNDFSGKECPQTLRKANLIWLFEEFVQNEYDLLTKFGNDFSITIESHNKKILSNEGHIITTPERTTHVTYDLIVEQNGVKQTKTLSTLIEGYYR